ncbi:DUF6461 domain-containing protein [Saccharopolyspora taberi]|uniref:Uncharacterized protein n=1 Tax=Saccharopolyspora taberi TaxID=60895 RepID=A0ABN3V696_9PSEU
MRSNARCQEVERFGWIRDSTVQEAACLTFVRATGVDPVAAGFGAVSGHARALDFGEFCEEAYAQPYPVIGLRIVGDWVLVVEDNGLQGTRPEVLTRVSARTEALSVFWNTNLSTRFSYAVGGEVRTTFEALLPEFREGTRPDALEELREGLPWSALDSGNQAEGVELMLALAARITGQPLTPTWEEGQFLTFPVAAWPEDLRADPDALERLADRCPPGVIDALRAADDRARRRAAVAVARRAAELAECADHPVISAVLASADDPVMDREAISEAVREWTWLLHRHRATSKVRNQVRAAEVLRQATHDDPLAAVCASLSAAIGIRGLDAAELSGVVEDALGRA